MRYLIFILTLLAVSCRTVTKVVEVPVETVRTEYISNVTVDSVYIRDSVDRYMKGDTVYLYKESFKYKYLYKTDTVVAVDSIPYTVEVVTVKEVNKLRWHQRFLMSCGWLLLLLLLLWLIFKLLKTYFKR